MRSTGAAITAVLLLALCPPALADDASLWRAYTSQDAAVARTMNAFVKASNRFGRKPSVRRAKAVIAADNRVIPVIRKLIKAISGENASSDAGATAKRLALKGLPEWRAMHVYMTRTMRAFIHRHRAAAKRWGNRAIRVGKRSVKHITAAEKAFKQAGYPHG
jgi:hypothetical protein